MNYYPELPFFQAAVWLKYGECHFEMGDLDAAEAAYSRVVELGSHSIDILGMSQSCPTCPKTLSLILNVD